MPISKNKIYIKSYKSNDTFYGNSKGQCPYKSNQTTYMYLKKYKSVSYTCKYLSTCLLTYVYKCINGKMHCSNITNFTK